VSFVRACPLQDGLARRSIAVIYPASAKSSGLGLARISPDWIILSASTTAIASATTATTTTTRKVIVFSGAEM